MEAGRVLQLLEPVLGAGLTIAAARTEDANTSTGYLAQHHHVTVVTPAGQSLALFLKGGLDNREISDFVTELNMDETELDFYRNLAPKLVQFERSESGVSHLEGMIPRFYAGETPSSSSSSTTGQPTLLILEDIGNRFVLKSFDTGISLEEAYRLVVTVANFHAATMAFANKHREEMNSAVLCKFADYVQHPFLMQGAEDTFAMISVMPLFKDNGAKLDAYKKFFAANLASFSSALRPHPDNRVYGRDNTACILHSDLWTNNIMFSGGEGAAGGQIKMVDFQMLLQGNPLYDISVAITFNIHLDIFTTANLSALAAEYYSVLNTRLHQLNVSHPDCLSPENFLRDFLSEGLKFSLVYWTFNSLPSQKYPRSLERFCRLLSLTEDIWNKA